MKSFLRLKSLLVLFVAFLHASLAYSGEATFGAEFTFENNITVNGDDVKNSPDDSVKTRLQKSAKRVFNKITKGVATEASRTQRDKMKAVIEKVCAARGDCTVTTSMRKWMAAKDYVVTYKDGWSWRISTDHSVVEIQTAPATAEQYRQYADRIRSDIFGSAAEAELFPGIHGGGHIHMGVQSAFENNPTLFRNYLVDSVNHSELALGIFSEDLDNAAPIAVLTDEQRREFARVIEEFDRGMINTTEDLAKQIQSRVYFKVFNDKNPWTPPEKFQQLNVTRVVQYRYDPRKQTLEDRALRAQQTYERFQKQIDLKQARLDRIAKLNGRVRLDPHLSAPETTEEKVRRFHQFVVQSGESWDDYKEFVFPAYQNLSFQSTDPGGLRMDPHSPRTGYDMTHPHGSRCGQSILRALWKLQPKSLFYFGN